MRQTYKDRPYAEVMLFRLVSNKLKADCLVLHLRNKIKKKKKQSSEKPEANSHLFQISFLRWQKDDCSKEKLWFKNNNTVYVRGNKYVLIAFLIGLAICY